MSGPKTGHYTVISGEQEVKRQLELVRGQAHVQETRCKELAVIAEANIQEFGDSIPLPPVIGDVPNVPGFWQIVKVEEWTKTTRELLDDYEEQLAKKVAEARHKAYLEKVEREAVTRTTELLKSGLHDADRAEVQKASDEVQVSESKSDQRASLLAGALTKLDRDAEELDFNDVRTAVEAVLEATSDEGQDLAKQRLDLVCAEINATRENRRRRRRERTYLLQRIDGLDGSEAEALRERLLEWPIESRDLDQSLTASAELVIEEDRLRRERAYVLQVATECLEDLGYEVQEGFETALQGGMPAHARNPNMAGYAVRIRADKEGQLNFNVVRSAEAGSGLNLRDREVEDGWCTDLQSLIEGLKKHDVELAITRAENAGALPVQVVTDLPTEFQPVAQKKSMKTMKQMKHD